MTEATAIRQPKPTNKSATLFYQVAMSQPASHLFEVTLQVNNWQSEVLDLKMPVWTPGSYLVREYARHVQDFIAENSQGEILVSQKASKNHWQISTGNASQLKISYRVYANELTVRTNHLDNTHGYFNGAALFFFIPGLEQEQIKVKVIPPHPDWQVTTTLPIVTGEENTFVASDFDTLVDTPIEVGTQQLYDFEVLGKPHAWAIWSQGNVRPNKLIKDTTKIIEVEAELFGELPYEQYIFLLHLSGSGYGGLEHKDSCTLNYPRFGFRDSREIRTFSSVSSP